MSRTLPEVVSIHIARVKAGALEELSEATLVTNKGIEGDRHFGKEKRQVTLIEEEALAAAERDYDVVIGPGESRRNVVVRNVPLNHLVGRRFRIGACVLEGVKLCEPCAHLQAMTKQPRVLTALTHRGGLCARVVEGGTLRAGDRIDIS